MTIIACEIFGCVSASDLVSWHESDSYTSNSALSLALETLGVICDPCELYRRFFDDIRAGCGDVFLFTSRNDSDGLFVVNMYRGLTDQFDLLTFGARCKYQKAGELKVHLRRFFDSAEYQIGFEEASISARLRELINRDLYPRKVEESGYLQQLIEG